MMSPNPNSISLLSFVASATILAGSASAALVDYSTSFSSTDSPAFENGTINDQNGWSAFNSAHYVISDADGLGLVGATNATGPVNLTTSTDLTSELAAGNTVTMSVRFNFVGTFTNQNNGRWLVGIGTDAVSSQPLLGGGVFFNNGGTNFFIADQILSNGSKVDTNTTFDSLYHTLTTTITRSNTTNEFEVTLDFDGTSSTSYTATDAGLWDGSSTAYAGFRWQGSQDGNVDTFSVSTVPEPGSAMLALAGAGLLCLRRRR